MRRAAKIGLIALPWLLLALVLWDQLRRMDFFAIDSGTAAHAAAHDGFFAELAYEGCVPPGAVQETARARGWTVTEMEGPPPFCHAPAGLQGWLRVEIAPPLPFSTADENDALIGFDTTGCMARWRYDSGPGSTCPD